MSPAAGRGRAVAFDPGTVRVGVAVSDSERTMAFPRPSITGGAGAAERCAGVAREEGAAVVVVGCPVHLDGRHGTAAQAATAFAEELSAALSGDGVPVVLHDERLTTVSATRQLKDAGVAGRASREKVDGAAAAVLLESWLTS